MTKSNKKELFYKKLTPLRIILDNESIPHYCNIYYKTPFKNTIISFHLLN